MIAPFDSRLAFALILLQAPAAYAASPQALTPSERAEYEHHAQTTVWIQDHVARGEVPQRGVHARAYGCVGARFEPVAGLAPEYRVGAFAEGPLAGIVRFSAGSPHHATSDRDLDVRGFALKLWAGAGTQDFLMISSPNPPGATPAEFQDFMVASARGKLAATEFIGTHLDTLKMWTEVASRPPASLITEHYWAITEFGMGEASAHFRVAPSFEAPCRPQDKRRGLFPASDFLGADFRKHLAAEPACFDFEVELESRPGEWRRAARVLIPAQGGLEAGSPRQTFCEALKFTPWNALAEHLPLGRLNASRHRAYEASAAHRSAGERIPAEPASPGPFALVP